MAIKGMTVLVDDNSGAKTAEIIGIPGNTRVRHVTIGARVKVAIKTALPNGTVKKGEVKDAIVTRLKNPARRANGTMATAGANGVVLVDPQGHMIGTRVLSVVAMEILDINSEIASKATGRY